MERNVRAIVSMLPLDAFCCRLMRLVAVASSRHHNRGMDEDIDRRLNPSTPICSLDGMSSYRTLRRSPLRAPFPGAG